ncbi:MFS transporter [Novosphingobium resinovorum]
MLALTTLGDLVTPRERPRYQGLFNATYTLSSIAGPVVGGAVTEWLGWRWVFYINLPVGAAALAMVWLTLPPTWRRERATRSTSQASRCWSAGRWHSCCSSACSTAARLLPRWRWPGRGALRPRLRRALPAGKARGRASSGGASA